MNKISPKKVFIGATILILACLLATFFAQTRMVQNVGLALEDQFLRLTSHRHIDSRISLIQINRLPGEERYEAYARVASALAKAGAKVIAFTFSMEEIEHAEKGRELLVGVTKKHGQIVHGIRMVAPEHTSQISGDWDALLERYALWSVSTKDATYSFIPSPLTPLSILSSAQHIGHTTFIRDVDRRIRHVPLVVKYDGKYYPALSLVVACKALGIPFHRIEFQLGKHLVLNRSNGKAIKIPIDDKGQMRIHFAAQEMEDFQTEIFERILQRHRKIFSDFSLTEFKDKIVFLGITDSTRERPFGVPTSDVFYTVGLHANVVNTILTGQFIKETSPLWNGVYLVGLTAVLIGGLIFVKRRGYLFAAIGAVVFVLFIFCAFIVAGVLFNLTIATLAGLLVVGMGLIWKYHEHIACEAERYQRIATELDAKNREIKNQKNQAEAERKKLIVAYDIVGNVYSNITGISISKSPQDIEASLYGIAKQFEHLYLALKEKEEERELFVKSIRHDLKAPLDLIEGYIARPQPKISIIQEAVTQAKQLVRQKRFKTVGIRFIDIIQT